jgi:hypothetical protein
MYQPVGDQQETDHNPDQRGHSHQPPLRAFQAFLINTTIGKGRTSQIRRLSTAVRDLLG